MSEKKAPYWCQQEPNVPKFWSASSLSTLAACPRKFELSYIEGWQGKETSLDLIFGVAYHTIQERFWHKRLAGASTDQALCEALDIIYDLPDFPLPAKAKQAGKTKEGLFRSMVWYTEQYNVEKALPTFLILPDGPALELPFQILLPLKSPDGDPYVVRGYIDALRIFDGVYTVWDYKTTTGGDPSDFYYSRFEIDLQNYIYTAATRTLTEFEFSQFMIDVAAVNKTYSVFGRRTIGLVSSELDEGLVDVQEWVRYAEFLAERNYWPKNGGACGFCNYSEICNKAPESRLDFLESFFEEKRRTEVSDERTA